MRHGYSILLREFVSAEEVEVGDCERFQVTCPACREAIFKKTRSRAGGEVTHFLSHYRADTPDEKDCELRVDAVSDGRFDTLSAEGRGQALDMFMAVLRDAVTRNQEANYPPGTLVPWIARVLARPVLDKFVVYVREAVECLLKMPDERNLIAGMLAGFPRFGDQSPFWHRRQASYVVDVLRHLMSPGAKANMRFMSAAAFIHIGQHAADYRREQPRLAIRDIGYDPAAAVNLIEALVNGKPEKILDKLVLRSSRGDVGTTPAQVARNMADIHRAMVGELIGPIVGLLGSVPFPDLVRDRNAVMEHPSEAIRFRRMVEALLLAADGGKDADGL